MSVIAEFTIPTDEFAFGRALTEADGMNLALEKIVPTGDAAMPYFWAEGGDFERFEREVLADPHVEELARLDQVDDAVLYRARWQKSDRGLLHCIGASEGVVLDAKSGGRTWNFQLRFANHEELTAFYNNCADQELSLTVDRVYSLADAPRDDRAFELTSEQREALVLALERGYFGVPSEVTLSELATEMDISQQALSKRIRRGNETVLRTALGK